MSTLRSGARIAALLLAGTAFAGVAQAQTIAGRVSDSTGTRSLQGAQVEVLETGRSAVTAADGGFRIPDLAPGTYNLRTTYSGAAPVETSVTVPETGEAAVSIVVGNPDEGSILVIGQFANLASSLSRQRNSDTVDTVLTRDAIGQFPDQNVAEALRRAPGVNILNDQGEGRFVSIRGLDPSLNSSSINGVRVPAPEAGTRAVALDTIASELIESITIRKSLTPDMDGDTLGGSIEIATTSPFDRRRDFLGLSISGSYNELRDEVSPRASFDFSTRITDNFGISGGASYFRRRFSTDNIELDGWNETDTLVFADTVEFRDYDVQRERIGSSLSLEWRPTPGTTLYARGLYSRFDDIESRARLTFEFDGDPSGGQFGRSATFQSADGEISVQRDLKDRQEVQEIFSITVGGETETGPWRLRYSGSYSRASERENGSVDPINFEQVFEDPGQFAVTIGGLDTFVPNYNVLVGNAAFSNPANYEFNQLDRTTLSDSVDEEWGARVDITRTFPLASGSLDLQFGGRARLREKSYDLTLDTFDGYDGDFTMADILGRQSYNLALIDPVPGVPALRDFLSAGFGRFERDDISSDFDSNIEDYDVQEDIYAGYALLRLDSGPWRVIAGARVEHTENDIRGNFVELIEEGGTQGGVVLDEDTIFVTPLQFTRSYTDFLPSINIRYAPTRDWVFRAGAYRTVVRPNIGDIAPRFTVEENDEGSREGEFGNPALTPYRAWNADATAEYYFARNAALQAGVFWKQIDDFIVRRTFEEITFNGVYADEAIIPVNGDQARVLGFEFSYQQALTFLPGFLGGLIATLNYTYTDAEGDLGDRTIRLPSSSEHTFNAVLGYERGPLSLRLAGVYRAGYLDEVSDSAEEDRYVRHHFQLDASARYRITPRVQVFAEISNAANEPYIAYQQGPSARRLLQYETYSWTGNFGLRANF